MQASVGKVEHVVVAGEFRKRDGRLLVGDDAKLRCWPPRATGSRASSALPKTPGDDMTQTPASVGSDPASSGFRWPRTWSKPATRSLVTTETQAGTESRITPAASLGEPSATRMYNVPLPLAAITRELCASLSAQGDGEKGYIGTVQLVERLAGLSEQAQ
jgi:hypothetical protein